MIFFKKKKRRNLFNMYFFLKWKIPSYTPKQGACWTVWEKWVQDIHNLVNGMYRHAS